MSEAETRIEMPYNPGKVQSILNIIYPYGYPEVFGDIYVVTGPCTMWSIPFEE